MSLDTFVPNHTYFIDRTTIIYGESGTGKSFIIKDMLYQLRMHVDQIIVISPTDISNFAYESCMVPKPCIHYTITSDLLTNILQRQTALVSVYQRANRMDILKSLYDRIPNMDKYNKLIKLLNDKIKDSESLPPHERKKNNDEYEKIIAKIMKKNIDQHREDLKLLDLSNDERYTLTYFDMNPRIVLIFDDCTESLQKFKNHPAFQSFFYRGRWGFLTIIMACHSDKVLGPELKKSAYISIYTNKKSANTCLLRDSCSNDKEDTIRIEDAISCAFENNVANQKLVYVRDENKFYTYIATPHGDFRFGSPILWEFCDKVKSTYDQSVTSNKFLNDFKIN